MNDVFLDTVGMIAVWDDTDQWHAGAAAAYMSLVSQGRRLVTTEAFTNDSHFPAAGFAVLF